MSEGEAFDKLFKRLDTNRNAKVPKQTFVKFLVDLTKS